MYASLGTESLIRYASSNGSTSWTWSGWINIADTRQVDGASDYVFSWTGTNSQINGFAISRGSDRLVYLWNGIANVARNIRDGSGFYHLVVSCNNGSASAYINGGLIMSGVSYSPIASGTKIVVGDWSEGGNKINGSMFDVYFVDGQALSPGVFAEDKPNHSSQWGPKHPNTVKATIGAFGNNGFYLPMQNDTSVINSFSDGNSKSWSVAGNPRYVKSGALRTLAAPGQTAIHLDSTKTTDYIRLTDADLDLSSKAWTVEFFVSRGENWNASKGIFSLDTTGGSTWESILFFTTASGITLYLSSTGSGWEIFSAAGVITTMDLYRNYHVALTRQTDGTIRLYVNGQYIQGTNGNLASGRTMLTIGSRASASGVGDLIISGWRVIKDTALYTGTGSFTPPTTLDNSVNGTITHYGGANTINSIGEDASGNGYHFVTDNFEHNSVTNHSMYNQFCHWIDESGFDGGVGDGGTMTTTNDMLGSIGLHEGKWYWEFTANTMFTGPGGGGNVHHFGVVAGNSNEESNTGVFGRPKIVRRADAQDQMSTGYGISNTTASGTLANFNNNSVIGFELDLDSTPCTLKYYENGNLQYTQSFNYEFYGYNYLIPFARSNGLEGYYNFGQGTWVTSNNKVGYSDENGYGRFQYQPSSGYKAICTANLNYPSATLNSEDHFKIINYTGTGGTQSITGAGFKPAFAWIKVYNTSFSGAWFDRHRGTQMLWPDAYNQSTGYSNELISFDSDGFTTGGNLHTGDTNRPYSAYLWKGSENSVQNTNGSVTTDTYVNDEGGFSAVRWTGTGALSATFGTGLSGRSCFTIVTNYSGSATNEYWIYFGEDDWGRARMNTSSSGFIDGQNAILHSTSGILSTSNIDWNTSGVNYIAYTWKTIPGFIKCGRFVASTNANGPYVHTGFRPQFLFVKHMTGTSSWQLVDEKNNPTNPTTKNYTLDTGVINTFDGVDLLTTGFKVRQNGGAFNGYDNADYAYFAIGKAPIGKASPR